MNHLSKSVVRENRTPRSVGTGGGQLPPVTRSRGCDSPAPLTYLKAYDTVAEARNSLASYFSFYNSRRSHSSLDRQTPDQAYFTLLPQIAAA